MKYAPLFCILLLAACANTEPISTPAPSMPPSATPPAVTPTVEQCAYVWAYQGLPDLSAQIDQAIKQIQSDASGRAEAYGENCVYTSSGQATFSAMETDFYFAINVKDLKDDNELGTWIINMMKIVEALPSSAMAGPQAGFVEFTFKVKDDQKSLRVQISIYKSLPENINATDIIPTLFPSP